jgi:hypothetical protein
VGVWEGSVQTPESLHYIANQALDPRIAVKMAPDVFARVNVYASTMVVETIEENAKYDVSPCQNCTFEYLSACILCIPL